MLWSLLNVLYSLGYISVGLELEHIMFWCGKKKKTWGLKRSSIIFMFCFNQEIIAKMFSKQKFLMKKEIVENNKKPLKVGFSSLFFWLL